MTLAAAAWGEDAHSLNAKDFRLFAANLIDFGNGLGSAVFSGLKVTQQTSPSNTVKAAAGRAILVATESGKFGGYHAWNDASANTPGTFTATSTNERKDFVILRVTGGVPALEIVQGTPAAHPAAEPAITGDNYIILALVTLPPSTTNITDAMIEDRRVFGGKWAQPWGILKGGSVQTFGSVAGATPSAASITSANVTVGAPNRLIRIDYSSLAILTTGSGDLSNWELCRDGSVIQSWQHYFSGPGTGHNNQVFERHFIDQAPTPGAHTYLVRWASNVASTGVDSASSTYKRQLTVSDAGPFANPD